MAKRINLNPDTYVRGGLMQDIDVHLVQARWTEYDFNGTIAIPVLAAKMTFEPLEGGDEHEEYLSAGKLDNFTPDMDNDGKSLNSPNDKEHMVQGTNWDHFIRSIKDCGGDLTVLTDDISILEGAKFHIVRKAAPKREGLTIQRKEGREAQILVVDKIISLPWDKKGKAKAAAKPAAGAAAKAAAPAAEAQAEASGGDEDMTMTAIGVISGLLAKGAIPINQLKVLSFRELNKDKSLDTKAKNAISGMINAAWLTENGFVVDGNDVSMPE